MKSILKFTIIVFLFSGCVCKKEHFECNKQHTSCEEIAENKFIKAKLISYVQDPDEIGLFSIGEENLMGLVAFTKNKNPEIKNVRVYNSYYIKIKKCHGMYWVSGFSDGENLKAEDITTTKSIQPIFKYHSLLSHNHRTLHVRGHIRKSFNQELQLYTGPQNFQSQNPPNPPDPMYNLEFYVDDGYGNPILWENAYGTKLVYEQIKYITELYALRDLPNNQSEFIQVYYLVDNNHNKKINEISVCHYHGEDEVECIEWYTNN